MSAAVSAPAPATRDDRWLWLLFALAWFTSFGFSLVGWENTLISRFEFRQAQTALSAAYIPAGCFPLAYETPVFGPPWSVPLEFPLYQAAVSSFSAVSGLSLDASGRLVSWLFFQLSLPAFFLLLGSAGVRRPARLLCLSLLLTSPLYLFFSRAFLIESTVLCGCAWFLAAFARWITTGRWSWLVVATLAGSVGATVKLTTMVVFGVASLLLATGLWLQRRREPAAGRTVFLRAVMAYTVPALAGFAWLAFSTVVRNRNADSEILKTVFGFWSFGDLSQRVSADFWLRTLGVWTDGLISEGGLILGLYLFARQRGPSRALVVALFAAFLSGQLIFSNLYKIHDYYFYGSGVFLIFALGVLLAEQFEDLTLPRWSRVGLPVLVMALQLAHYGRSYLPDQRRNQEPGELVHALADLTRPNDTVVFIGLDWDATVPYYAHRRALMYVNGREWNRPAMKRSIDRLDPNTIGAVVIIGGLRSDSDFVAQTMQHLDLGAAPLLVSQTEQIGLWFPRARHAEVRDRLPLKPYPTLDVLPERPAAGATTTIGLREISRLRAFDRLIPRPFQATSPNGFSLTGTGSEMLLNAHAPTELTFRAPAQARRIVATFGIHDGAYTAKEHTDGVEFVVVNRLPDQTEKILFRRFLDPFTQSKDQGRQELDLPVTASLTGVLIFRTLPGPHDNYSFDWAYWGKIEIR